LKEEEEGRRAKLRVVVFEQNLGRIQAGLGIEAVLREERPHDGVIPEEREAG
jgi:hypothetical protein